VILIPFGFDAIGWTAMGYGIEGMIRIANFVTSLGGAEGRIAALGAGALLAGTLALLVLTIPATRLRWIGLPFAALALLWMWNGPRYDVMIDAEGDVVALRTQDGSLSVYTNKSDRFTVENWMAANGLPPQARRNFFACDQNGCVGKLPDGALVAIPKTPVALLEDCGRAALIIASRNVPESCTSPVIDRGTLATTGAIALKKTSSGWEAIPSRAPNADRPWYGRAKAPDGNALTRLNPAQTKQAVPLAPPAEISNEVPAPDAPEDDFDDQ
jgi:competence protein ComEC